MQRWSGAWISVHASIHWDMTELFAGGLSGIFDWDTISVPSGVAYGVHSASMEFGVSAHVGVCCAGNELSPD
jgi:hypothetical protein